MTNDEVLLATSAVFLVIVATRLIKYIKGHLEDK